MRTAMVMISTLKAFGKNLVSMLCEKNWTLIEAEWTVAYIKLNAKCSVKVQ